MLHNPQATVPNQASQILPASREEVVQNDDRVIPREQTLDKMAADEPGASGYQAAHNDVPATFHSVAIPTLLKGSVQRRILSLDLRSLPLLTSPFRSPGLRRSPGNAQVHQHRSFTVHWSSGLPRLPQKCTLFAFPAKRNAPFTSAASEKAYRRPGSSDG